ncbi:carbon storage regulator [Stenotrophomonas sp. LARHCG68]
MCRKTLNGRPPSPIPGSVSLRMALGETIHVGPDINVRLIKADAGHAVLSIFAPRSVSIDREKNFRSSKNSDGQGAPTPQPSATNSPSSTKTQE